MKSSVCPKPKVIRRLNFSESRICPNIYRMFRSVDWTHGMIIVKWREVTLIIFPKAEFARICKKIYRMFRSVDWTHDMIIVKWHLFIGHVRKLCALTYAPTVQSTQTGQWLSTLFHVNFHANCSAAQVYVLHPRQFKFALYKLKATIIFAGRTIRWAPRKIFCKIFCVSDDDKRYGEGMSWPEKYKKFEVDSGIQE